MTNVSQGQVAEIRALRLQDLALDQQETRRAVRSAIEEGNFREPTALSEDMRIWALETAHEKTGTLRRDGKVPGTNFLSGSVPSLVHDGQSDPVCYFQCQNLGRKVWGWTHLACLFRSKALLAFWTIDLL